MLGIVLTIGKIPPEAQALRPADFYGHAHSRYWTAMRHLDAASEPVDSITVRAFLARQEGNEPPEKIAVELCSLLDDHWLVTSLAFYVDILRKKSALRQVIENSSNIIQLAHSEPDDIQELVAASEKQVAALHAHCADLDTWGFPLRIWDLSRAAMEQVEKVDWLVEPLLAAPDVVNIVGDGGLGKSKVGAGASLSVGFGKPFWGNFQVKKIGHVIYINEERPDLTLRHLHTLAPSLDIDRDEIAKQITLLGGASTTWRITNPAARQALVRYAKKQGDVVLIVWDSLHVLHDQDENDNAQMTAVIEGFRKICSELGCCGLILHHTSKASMLEHGASARGASAIKDTVDGQIVVRRRKEDVPEELRFAHDKTRRALVPPFLLRLEHDPQGDLLGISWLGKATTKADDALEAVLGVLRTTTEPLKSAAIAMKLVGKFGSDVVYAALKVVRDQDLAPWRVGGRGVFIYGDEPNDPKEKE